MPQGVSRHSEKGTQTFERLWSNAWNARQILHPAKGTNAPPMLQNRRSLDGSDPAQNYHLIRRELEQYSSLLAEKPEIIVATKTDLDSTHDKLKAFREAIDGEVIEISSVTGFQIDKLSEHLWRQAQQIKEQNA